MLSDGGSGNLSWSETLGTWYRGAESRAGQIVSFELLIETTPSSTVTFTPRIDGAPLPVVWVGDQPFASPPFVNVPLAGVAGVSPVAEAQVNLAPGASTSLTFSLPPGFTYVGVVDPEENVTELDEHNNAFRVVVPALEPPYFHWPDYQ